VNEILENTIGMYTVTAYATFVFVKTLGKVGCL